MKIIVADDHALFRDGLRHALGMLDAQVTVIEAADYPMLMHASESHPDADLVLVDLRMPGADPFAGLRALLTRHPTLLVVILSGSEDPVDMRRALDAGAMGYIPKREDSKLLLNALRLVLAGGIYIPPLAIQTTPVEPPQPAPRDAIPRGTLTPRQIEVLRELAGGKSNREISTELQLSEATVKAHVTAILRLLNVSSRSQALLVAARIGIL